ncbi:hypothetical protein TG4357_01679 [Thalassovita gelatinovora]|uniref:Uncharacterized protein n=1 Tax=Thalassovita gelatinovora TaxID=53501 RepID=A0A0P1G040_THAGE|nr:hypothetical protein TG4357_01679 [Thalassovita gelatinovora]
MPPVQVVVAFGTVATVMLAGRLSLKASAVAGTKAPVLSMVKVSVEVAPWSIALGENAAVKPGVGAAVIDRVALAAPLSPIDEVRSPVVFAAFTPDTARTSTEIVQLLPAETDPPL